MTIKSEQYRCGQGILQITRASLFMQRTRENELFSSVRFNTVALSAPNVTIRLKNMILLIASAATTGWSVTFVSDEGGGTFFIL